jgi:hypothetical protein
MQYAVEWKGIGRSERPAFKPKSAAEADAFFVESLEDWRKELQVGLWVARGNPGRVGLTPSSNDCCARSCSLTSSCSADTRWGHCTGHTTRQSIPRRWST